MKKANPPRHDKKVCFRNICGSGKTIHKSKQGSQVGGPLSWGGPGGHMEVTVMFLVFLLSDEFMILINKLERGFCIDLFSRVGHKLRFIPNPIPGM